MRTNTRRASIEDLLALGEHLVSQIRKDIASGSKQVRDVRLKPRIAT